MLSNTILALAATTALAAPQIPNRARSTTKASYSLTTSYKGSTFFDNFSFFADRDPTNGFVKYTSREQAIAGGLVGFIHNTTSNASTAYIGVDHTTTTTVARNSVRLIGNEKFNAGSMAVIDVRHLPSQWGVWPAIWMLGADGIWPNSGESDILEYVHTGDANAMTLHTAPGFNVDNSTEGFQGSLVDSNCNAGDPTAATKGCSITMESKAVAGNGLATAGEAFNAQGGGVYVHDWTPEGITVWLFPREGLPADLVAGKPDSSTWTQKPLAKFTGTGDFGTTLKNMQLIINIDLCGDWAGKDEVWTSSGALKATGAATCAEYVGANPDAYKEAYFAIDSIDFYTAGASNATTTNNKRAAPTDSASHFEPLSTLFRRDEASTSDATATEFAGWLVAAGMFCVAAAFV